MGRDEGGFGARDLRGKRRGVRRVCGARGRLCPLQIQALAFQSAALENQSAALENQIAELWRQGGGRRGRDCPKAEWDGRMGAGRSAAAATISLIRYARVRARHTKRGLGRQNGEYFEKNRENVWQERSNAVSLHPLSR